MPSPGKRHDRRSLNRPVSRIGIPTGGQPADGPSLEHVQEYKEELIPQRTQEQHEKENDAADSELHEHDDGPDGQ